MTPEEQYMNIKDNLLFFFCVFPVFVFKSNLDKSHLIIIIFFFIFLFLINILFLNFLKKKNKYFKTCYLSLILVFGIDNHLGLFNGVIQSNISFFLNYFKIVYIPAIGILIVLFILIFTVYLITDQNKISKIFLISIITIFSFNIYDDTKSYSKIPFFEKKIDNKLEETTLILIWDEMSGLNSLSSKTKIGKEINIKFEDFFKKYNFTYYTETFSISKNSVGSITSLINFREELDNFQTLVKPSENYFVEYEIKKNLLFDKFNSISVIQNIHIDYCKNIKVNKCYQYNPLNLEIINAQTDILSNFISTWSLNGSIVAKLFWRFFKQFEIINSTLEPEGEKLFINNLLNYAYIDIISKKYDLIFVHLLVPHKPYGFNNECNYEIGLSNLNIFMDLDENIKQHNIERNCVIKFMDFLFSKINNLNNLEIFIMSDHGSRITNEENSSLSTIFAHKNFMQNKFKKITEKNSIQHLFKKINNE